MTELEILMMRVPGLSELEAKELIKILYGLDDLNTKKMQIVAQLLVEKTGLSQSESEHAVSLLAQLQENQ